MGTARRLRAPAPTHRRAIRPTTHPAIRPRTRRRLRPRFRRPARVRAAAPPGYGPPGYPGGYYPGPDYGGYPPQPPLLGGQPGTNGLAIASLIASFTGLLCGIGSVVAIVLGAIALDQIKRTRQDGFGLAVAGIVIGIATLVVTLVVVLFALHTH